MGYETLVEVLKHLPGQHDQSSHAGDWKAKGVPSSFAQDSADTLAEDLGDLIGENARASDVKSGKSKILLFLDRPYTVNKVTEHLAANKKKYGLKKYTMTPSAKQNYYDLVIDFGKVYAPKED